MLLCCSVVVCLCCCVVLACLTTDRQHPSWIYSVAIEVRVSSGLHAHYVQGDVGHPVAITRTAFLKWLIAGWVPDAVHGDPAGGNPQLLQQLVYPCLQKNCVISKSKNFLGQSDDIWGARGPPFPADLGGSRGPGRPNKYIFFSPFKRPPRYARSTLGT